mmetsp:Transcript_21537/g.44917  ORF Transcript_21537/g.44917 Transcript_21537/m.44917 type:complete len:433 (-) Transcript_21537:52-1350(-)
MGACGSKVVDKFNPDEIDETHFDLHTTIGKGGFGHVHMVVKKSGDDKDKMYAQKRQIISSVCSKKMEMEVFRELDFLKDLNHTFICNAHYAFHDNTYLYLIMDIALGGDLRFHINKRLKEKQSFTPQEARFFISCIILALEYLHNEGVLHRDLKPDNFLLGTNGYVKLTDFGISSFVDKKTMMCSDSSGTNGYMAPEIYKEGHRHNVASECFSLGVCLHEFVCLTRPFKREYGKDIIAQIKTISPTRRTHLSMAENDGGKTEYDELGGIKIFDQTKKNLIADSSDVCKDCVKRLLYLRPSRRLGGGKDGGMKAIKKHPYFQENNWDDILSGKAKAPFLPDTSQRNASGFQDDINDAFSDGPTDPPGSAADIEKFVDYVHNIEYGDRPSESLRRSGTVHMSGRDRQMEIRKQTSGAEHVIGEMKEEEKYDDEE